MDKNLDLDLQDFFINWCNEHNITDNQLFIIEKDELISLLQQINNNNIKKSEKSEKLNKLKLKIIQKNASIIVQVYNQSLVNFFYKKNPHDNYIFVKSDKFIIKSFVTIHLYETNSRSYKVSQKKRKLKTKVLEEEHSSMTKSKSYHVLLTESDSDS